MNPALLSLLLAAFFLIHCLIGGTQLVFSLPAGALLAAAALLSRRLPALGAATVSSRCLLATGGVFSYLLVRAAFSPVPYLARADIFLLLACLIVYLLTALFLVTPRQRMLVVGGLLVLGMVHTLVGIVQVADGEDFMLFGFLRAPSGSRASGLFISPNHFAGFLEIAGILALSVVWWSSRKPLIKVCAGFAVLSAYAGVLLSQSRGGFLCAGVSLVTWAVLSVRTHTLKKSEGRSLFAILLALAVLVCGGGWFTAQHFDLQDRLATTFGPDIRLVLWQGALEQFRSAPVLGTGAGTHLYLGRLYRQPELQSDPIHAHSDCLELLAEYGLVGAVGMAVFLALHAFNGWQAIGRFARVLRVKGDWGGDELALAIAALAALVGFAAHSFIDFNLHIPGNALVVAFLCGILAQPSMSGENTVPPPRLTTVAARWALPALGGVLLGFAILTWPGEYFTEWARIGLRNEEYSAAAARAKRACRLDPWNPFAFFYLGEAHRLAVPQQPEYVGRQASRAGAEQAFAAGLRLFPQDENLLVRRGQVLDGLGRFDEAEASFQAALAADPRLEVLRQLYEQHRERRRD